MAPALTWQPTSDTSLTVLTNIQVDKLTPNNFLPVAGKNYPASVGELPESFVYSQSDYNHFNANHGGLGYEFEHRFNAAFQVRQNLRFSAQETDYHHLYYNGMANNTTMNYVAFTVDENATIFNVDNQLQYEADFGPVENTLLTGVDYSRHQVDGNKRYEQAYTVSVLDPNFNFDVTEPPIYQDGVQTIDRVGIYAQNQARIFDRWLLTLGGRQSWVRNTYDDRLANDDTRQDDQIFSGMAGLGYDFDNGITPYVSYSESFVTNVGSTFDGSLFKPSEAGQVEAGIKYQPTFFNGFFSVAVFDITKTNVLTTDPNNANFQVQTGEVNHRGIELEGNVSLGNGLSLTTGYTYLDAKITKSNDGDEGNRPARVPEHQASLWANYKIPEGALEGLSLGAGVRYIGDSYADNANAIPVDGYTLFDSAVRYERNNYELSLNVSNVFDEDYYATCSTSGCIRGEGRVIKGMFTAKF
ncbi:TonB-dependent siderophore receptor [Roseibium salinum]|nr:TonB-dependent siderophore receptor [Roseibium salinum]